MTTSTISYRGGFEPQISYNDNSPTGIHQDQTLSVTPQTVWRSMLSGTMDYARSFFSRSTPQENAHMPNSVQADQFLGDAENLHNGKLEQQESSNRYWKSEISDDENDSDDVKPRRTVQVVYDSEEELPFFPGAMTLTRIGSAGLPMRDPNDYELYLRDSQVEYIELEDKGYYSN